MKAPRPIRLLAASILAGMALGLPLRTAAADAPAATTMAKSSYALTSGDLIRVGILGEDGIPPQRIDTLGNVTLPLIGDFHVGGMTRDAAQQAIAEAYVNGRFLRHPDVTVSIDDYAPREVSITGMVKNPGRFPLPVETPFSVVELVTKAGGFTDIAKGSAVLIIRADLGKAGKRTVIKVDVESIIKGKSSLKSDDPSILLHPGDSVYVPESII